jgi:hypothetical protein
VNAKYDTSENFNIQAGWSQRYIVAQKKKQKHSFSVGAGRRFNMYLTLNDASEEGTQLLRSASVGSNGGNSPTL